MPKCHKQLRVVYDVAVASKLCSVANDKTQ